jgi:hypothetical protein
MQAGEPTVFGFLLVGTEVVARFLVSSDPSAAVVLLRSPFKGEWTTHISYNYIND